MKNTPSVRFLFVLSICALLVSAGLTGCIMPVVEQSVPYSDADFAPYKVEGTGKVKGSAFLKTAGGDVKLGAGNTVELIPVTPYTRERFGLAKRYVNLAARDPRLAKHIKTTTADAQGYFTFSNVVEGEYFLTCMITWEYGPYSQMTGGQALAYVNLSDGEEVNVVLTK